jgi:N-acetylated-alpha-linked acidic dipeptidase
VGPVSLPTPCHLYSRILTCDVAPAEGSNPSIPGERIPSLPVSYSDIIPILGALQGYGPKASEMSSSWHGGGLYYKGVDYYVGPSSPRTVLNMNNQMKYATEDIYQVFGKIEGTIKDEVIVIGNHRDSWTAGAGDSVSGATALMVRFFPIQYLNTQ